MNDIFTIVTNFGLGIGSFVALIFFYNKFMSIINDSLKSQTNVLNNINESQIKMQTALETLSDRVEKLENNKK